MTADTEFICPNPNCGYKGKPKAEGTGSWTIAVVLMLLFIVPGLLYMMFGIGNKYTCPKCNIQVGKS